MKSRALLGAIACSLLAAAFVVAVTERAAGDDAMSRDEFFERHVRPLLAEKCFSCHGRGQRKGGLSLDSRDALMAGGESGSAVVEGRPQDSLLVESIEYSGSLEMPPDGKLSEREVEILKQWVTLGLPWPAETASSASAMRSGGEVTEQDRQFWSFRPIREPQLPTIRDTQWPRRPLDYFVLSRLESEGLKPVAEADRRTYIRRAAFDLLGLPPTDAEIEHFASDRRPDAYERLIDRLLEAPQYGQRWSRHWLDIARYGEDQAHTFQARRYPSGYRYRDWVVDSLNNDLPIDDFLMQQVASDHLPGDDRLQRLPALGYFSLGPVYYADAGCAPKAKADEYDDRIDTLTRGILGLTVSCARCHDHKFDPITMHDYYALAGIFASTEYVEVPLAPAEQVKAYEDAQAAIKESEQQLKTAEADAARRAGEAFATRTADYLLVAWQVLNRRKVEPAYEVARAIEGTDLHEFLVEHWLQALASDVIRSHAAFKPWQELVHAEDASIDLSQDTVAKAAIGRVATDIQSQLMTAIQLRRDAEAEAKTSDKRSKRSLPGDVSSLLTNLVDNANAPLAIPKDRVAKHLDDDARQQLAALKKSLDERKKNAPAKYDVVHSLQDGQPANQKIHLRGNVNDLGEEVPRRFIEVLSASCGQEPFTQGSGRLQLAKAIVSPTNPLTARVFVNRVWQHHFGRGIVATPSNFGLLGVPPTHPELLDYLAARFIASGWSLKRLHREIMLSSTYRLASAHSQPNFESDPENRLLWRMHRRRLDIESWRDSLLMVAGNIDLTMGGPSANLADKNNRRRTLYAAISRHELNPVLRLFDFPDPNLTSERRSLTTVPMQQLFVLNSDFMVDQSRAVAARLEKANLPDTAAKVEQLYRWLFGRQPLPQELRLGVGFVDRSPDEAGSQEAKLSRLEQYTQALLSTNEFFFVD